jgi:hypothetical protein
VIVDMQVWSKIARRRYLPRQRSLNRKLTGRMRSRSHHTISEHRCGSGAMIKTGSAAIRHSHNDHSEGRIVANARNGEE